VVAAGVDTRAEWTTDGGAGGGAMVAGEVVAEGGEKGVGGRTEYCVGL